MTVRVVLVDDQPLVRAGLRVLIADTPDLTVVGEAGTGDEAVRAGAGHALPTSCSWTSGCRAWTASRRPGGSPRAAARVLILTTFDDDEYVYGALRAGASGFLVKDMALEEILAAVRVVAAGDALLAPSVTRRLIADFATRSPARSRPIAGITEREREVLTLVGRGLTNAEIAGQLFISVATAKAHVARLLTKLEARDRVQLVIIAHEAGVV